MRRLPSQSGQVPLGRDRQGVTKSAKGEYALFTKEELANLDGEENTGAIEIVEFVDPLGIDLAVRIDKSYWVGPASKNVRGYDLLRSGARRDARRVALVEAKLRTRTRLVSCEASGRLFSLDMMRFADELVPGDELAPAEQKEPSPREKQLARCTASRSSSAGPFDPAKHPDEYRTAVLAAVDEKVEAGQVARDSSEAGEAPAAGGESTGAQVIDLAELLSRSIKAAGKPGPAKAKSDDEEQQAEEKKATKGGAKKPKRATG